MEPTTHRHRLTPVPAATFPPFGPGAAAAPGAPPPGVPGSTSGLGRYGEALAVRHLTDDDGLTIVARNWRISEGELRGELDIVARGADGMLVVVEVKTRRDAERFGGALDALSAQQGRRLRHLTGAFVRQAQLRVAAVRLDVVAVDLGREATLTHVESAL